jgi:ribosomal protein S18 acetylase RimI-like enzyme
VYAVAKRTDEVLIGQSPCTTHRSGESSRAADNDVFSDRAQLPRLGGPEFRFPFTPETFLADSKLTSLPSYALIREKTELCGFGQFYLRVGRCHLSRLAVAPAHRDRGLGTQLIEILLREGKKALGVTQGSLFVHVTNTSAIALYERLGFTRTPYPEPGFDIPNSYYMILSRA